MSALQDLVTGKTSQPTTKTAPKGSALASLVAPTTSKPVATKSTPTKAQYAPLPTNLPNVQVDSGNPAFRTPSGSIMEFLPDGTKKIYLDKQFGNGVYTTDPNTPNRIINQGHTTYGGVPSEAGMNRDDIIPVSLGGVNTEKGNINVVPKADNPADFETEIARKVKSGEMTLGAGRNAVMTYKQQHPELTTAQKIIATDQPTTSTLKNLLQPSTILGATEKVVGAPLRVAGGVVNAGAKAVQAGGEFLANQIAEAIKPGSTQGKATAPVFDQLKSNYKSAQDFGGIIGDILSNPISNTKVYQNQLQKIYEVDNKPNATKTEKVGNVIRKLFVGLPAGLGEAAFQVASGAVLEAGTGAISSAQRLLYKVEPRAVIYPDGRITPEAGESSLTPIKSQARVIQTPNGKVAQIVPTEEGAIMVNEITPRFGGAGQTELPRGAASVVEPSLGDSNLAQLASGEKAISTQTPQIPNEVAPSTAPVSSLENLASSQNFESPAPTKQPAQEGTKIYHTTNSANKQAILDQGFKAGNELPENAFRGGGYGQIQNTISFAEDPKSASRFGISGNNTMFEAELKPDAKIINRPDIEYAEDLNNEVDALRKQGVDAVRIGDRTKNYGENEIVVLNKQAIKRITKAVDFKGTEAKSVVSKFQAQKPTKPSVASTLKEKTPEEYANMAATASFKTSEVIRKRMEDAANFDVQEVPQDLKISKEVKKIIEEFGTAGAEKSLSKRLLGVFKPLSNKVRVQSLYDLTTAVHEVTHSIDVKHNISKIIGTIPGNSAIRKELSRIYSERYGAGELKLNRPQFLTHQLNKRLTEGLATFIENYFYHPSLMQQEYPNLVKEFISPEGRYYNADIGKLLTKMNSLADSYARLSPEERIGARIRTGDEVVRENDGFTVGQRLTFQLFDKFEPLRRYAKQVGVSETWEDPTIQAFNYLNRQTLVANWVDGASLPILKPDGNFEIRPGSVKQYEKMLGNNSKAFRSYLIARRQLGDYNRLATLRNLIIELESRVITQKANETDMMMLAEAKKHAHDIDEMLKRDDFSLQDVTAVVEKYADKFQEPVKMFDAINNAMVDQMLNAGLIDAKKAQELKANDGYASFKRFVDDEISGSVGTISSSRSKVSSLKQRHGSNLDIVDPVYNQIQAINEVMGKSLENILWQKVFKLARRDANIGQRFEVMEPKVAVDKDGNISYPQEKDPSLIRIFVDGKRVFIKAAPEFLAVNKVLHPEEIGQYAKAIRIPSSVFTRLTTSANPLFALGNLTIDQFTALSQTKTGFKPIIDPMKSLGAFMAELAENSEKLKPYMTPKQLEWADRAAEYRAIGGERATLAAYYDLSPEDIANRLQGGKTLAGKITHVIDSAVGILELPSNTSELMTRFAEYNRAINNGDPASVALYRASDVTTPFQLSGNLYGVYGETTIRSIPYLNAALQVLYKFGRSAKSNPTRLAAVYAGVVVAGLAFLITTMKLASEKQKRQLAETPAAELAKAVYIPLPTGDGFIRIRIPEIAGSILGTIALFVIGNYGLNKATFDEYLNAATGFLPQTLDVAHPGQMAWAYIPQVVKPLVQVAPPQGMRTYPDFLPIVPDSLKNAPPKEQYTQYTSRVAKLLGNLMNVSPLKVEYIIKGYFGQVGGALLGKLPLNPIYRQEEDFVMAGRSYNDFYTQQATIEQQYNQIKNTHEVTAQEKQNVKDLRSAYSDMAGTLADLRKVTKENIELDENLKSRTYNLLLSLDNLNRGQGNVRDVQQRIAVLNRDILNYAKLKNGSTALIESLMKK